MARETGVRIDEVRINNIESRLNNIDTRLNNLDSRLSNAENQLTTVPPQNVNTQLMQQLNRIEQGGRRNSSLASLAFSVSTMIYAGNLLTANPRSIPGIILVVLGIFLFCWSSWNFPRRQ